MVVFLVFILFLTYLTSNALENLICIDLEIYWNLTTFQVNVISLYDRIASQVVPHCCSCPTCVHCPHSHKWLPI